MSQSVLQMSPNSNATAGYRVFVDDEENEGSTRATSMLSGTMPGGCEVGARYLSQIASLPTLIIDISTRHKAYIAFTRSCSLMHHDHSHVYWTGLWSSRLT